MPPDRIGQHLLCHVGQEEESLDERVEVASVANVLQADRHLFLPLPFVKSQRFSLQTSLDRSQYILVIVLDLLSRWLLGLVLGLLSILLRVGVGNIDLRLLLLLLHGMAVLQKVVERTFLVILKLLKSLSDLSLCVVEPKLLDVLHHGVHLLLPAAHDVPCQITASILPLFLCKYLDLVSYPVLLCACSQLNIIL